jgi:hypothetical protein
MIARLALLILAVVIPASAQLTKDQRLSDFRNLVDLYARRYAGAQWKKTVLNFDLLDLSPWLPRVAAAGTDLEFYDLMVEYVGSLQDAHDQYILPTDFEAWLDISCDIYDGKVLIDSINRKTLPARTFPFQVGDEILKVDGKPVADLIRLFSKYVSGGNPRTVQRLAAELLVDRYQGYYPWAHEVGDFAAVEIRSQTGMVATYSLPWNKFAEPGTTLGPSTGPFTSAMARRAAVRATLDPSERGVLGKLRTYKLPGRVNVIGFGRLARCSVFPPTSSRRLAPRLRIPISRPRTRPRMGLESGTSGFRISCIEA